MPAFLQLTRPGNVLITGLTVFVGGVIASGGADYSAFVLILAGLSAGLVAAGANALNDFHDLAIDLINCPDRPIPSGRISRTGAAAWGWLLMIAGVTLGFRLAIELGWVAFIVATLLWLYNKSLKRTYLLGNFAVALCGGAAFIYGGLAVGKVSASLIPAAFAFMIHLAREIVKDVDDIAGDLAAGARTLPIVSGRRSALIVTAVVLIVLACSTPLPWLFGIYTLKYLVLVTLTVAIPLLIIAISILLGVQSVGVKQTSLYLKLIMITGLISLYVG